jgi:tRNA (guanine6-N2)-methyltransferase
MPRRNRGVKSPPRGGKISTGKNPGTNPGARERDKAPGTSAKPFRFTRFSRRAASDKGAEASSGGARATPAFRFTPNIYIAHVQPGFESIAAEEIASRYEATETARGRGPAVRELGRRIVADRAGMTVFRAPGAAPASAARTIEDLFALAAYRDGLGADAAALERVRIVAHEAPYVENGLLDRVKISPGSRAGRRLGFRVIARMAGDYEFRRIDFQRAVERGITDRGDHSWRQAGDDADVEFWATLVGGEMFLALRLTGERTRHREYKVAHRPGSLRPSVAAALAWLCRPRPEDFVIDPMCGAGTILIERAHLGRYAMLAGFDRDPEAIAAARENIGPRYRPIGVARADAARLPLGNGSASSIATNLPWGIKHGSHEENRRLYPRLIEEFARVVRPGGRIVMLTSEWRLMREATSSGIVRVESVRRVTILGASAVVYVCTV